VKTKG